MLRIHKVIACRLRRWLRVHSIWAILDADSVSKRSVQVMGDSSNTHCIVYLKWAGYFRFTLFSENWQTCHSIPLKFPLSAHKLEMLLYAGQLSQTRKLALHRSTHQPESKLEVPCICLAVLMHMPGSAHAYAWQCSCICLAVLMHMPGSAHAYAWQCSRICLAVLNHLEQWPGWYVLTAPRQEQAYWLLILQLRVLLFWIDQLEYALSLSLNR